MISVILTPFSQRRCLRFDHDKSNSCAMTEIMLKYAINVACCIEGWFQPQRETLQWSRLIHINCSKSNILTIIFFWNSPEAQLLWTRWRQLGLGEDEEYNWAWLCWFIWNC